MNLIAQLTARIEEFRATNARPCKSYATEQAAEKATGDVAKLAARHMLRREDAAPARYVVFFNEAWGCWVGCVDMTELLSRKGAGGYVGICKGFFSY